MSDDTRDRTPDVETQFEKKRGPLADFFMRLVKKPLGLIGGAMVLLLLLTGIFADLTWLGMPNVGLAPYGMNEIDLKHILQGAVWEADGTTQFMMGTDQMGRDVLSRLIHGARISMIVGVGAAVASTLISFFIGVVSGFVGGWVDIITQRFVDAWMAFPILVILLTIMSLLGPGMWQVILVLSIMFGVGSSRVIRGAVLAIKQNMYFAAATATGCSRTRILLRHVLPNIMPILLVMFSGGMAAIILTESMLSFVGMGIPPPQPSWGGMLGAARPFMIRQPLLAIWPGLAISIVVFGINMFGDALRDLQDPRMRGGLGRYGRAMKRTKAALEGAQKQLRQRA